MAGSGDVSIKVGHENTCRTNWSMEERNRRTRKRKEEPGREIIWFVFKMWFRSWSWHMWHQGEGEGGRSYNLRLAGRGGHLGRVQLFPGPKPHAKLATADNQFSLGQFPWKQGPFSMFDIIIQYEHLHPRVAPCRSRKTSLSRGWRSRSRPSCRTRRRLLRCSSSAEISRMRGMINSKYLQINIMSTRIKNKTFI